MINVPSVTRIAFGTPAKVLVAILLAASVGACVQMRPMPMPPPVVELPPPVVEAPPPPPPPPIIMAHPVYLIGDPYQAGGVWYYPKDQPDLDETGIASWHSGEGHEPLTANGELFDVDAVTAAHPTLPLPTNVRVTNLENGRSLVVRINDRGVNANGRIIDLSEHAADLLGFKDQGTARVRMTYLGRAALNGPGLATAAEATPDDIAMAVPAAPVTEVEMMALAPVMGVKIAPARMVAGLPMVVQHIDIAPVDAVADGRVMEMPVPAATSIYVDLGDFTSPTNAAVLAQRLYRAGARIFPSRKDGKPFYRVRIGPFQAVQDADAALAQVQALGHNDVQIVVDSTAS